MKKVFSLILTFIMVVTLLSCEQEPTIIKSIDLIEVQSQITETIEKVEKSVVIVESHSYAPDSEGKTLQGHGSGLIFKKDEILDETGNPVLDEEGKKIYRYYVVTNEHVISSGFKYKAVRYDELIANSGIGSPITYNANLKGSINENGIDIAVISFTSNDDLPFVPLKPEPVDGLEVDNIYKKGQFVIAIGSPLQSQTYYNYSTLGIISKIDINSIYHDAPINSGNSGGPLFNIMGDVVGINVSKITKTGSDEVAVEGMGRAIHIDKVRTAVEEILSKDGFIERVSLGVTTTSLANFKTSETYRSFQSYIHNIPIAKQIELTDNGVIIVAVNEIGSSAGIIEQFDVIYKIDGVLINNISLIKPILNTKKFGDKVDIQVFRSGVLTNLEVVFLEYE